MVRSSFLAFATSALMAFAGAYNQAHVLSAACVRGRGAELGAGEEAASKGLGSSNSGKRGGGRRKSDGNAQGLKPLCHM